MADNDVPNLRKVPAAYRQRDMPTTPSGDPNVDRLQESARKCIDDMNGTCPILRGRHVIPTTPSGDYWLPAGSTTVVEHGLGRAAIGWLVHDIIGGPNLLERIPGDNLAKTITIKNNHAGAVACALWVY